jgi:hypothetical protein
MFTIDLGPQNTAVFKKENLKSKPLEKKIIDYQKQKTDENAFYLPKMLPMQFPSATDNPMDLAGCLPKSTTDNFKSKIYIDIA